VLQPNPNFAGGDPPPAPSREGAAAVAKSSTAAARPPSGSGTVFSKAAAASAAASRQASHPVKHNKNELLENMTKQLQVILTKLNDKTLNDEMREKYQALAQNIQVQMAKISRPQAPKRRI